MGFLDSLKRLFKREAKNEAEKGVKKGVKGAKQAHGTEKFSFSQLPTTLEELQALPEASLDTPFKTAALTILALNIYSNDFEEGEKCINFLRGPKGALMPREKQFFEDRIKEKNGKLIAKSYFVGATPDNEYEAPKPYKLEIFSNSHSYEQATYCKLHIMSGGADSERQITLRTANGKWYLWDQLVMVSIKVPKSQNPWG